jgi:hypothetical protein
MVDYPMWKVPLQLSSQWHQIADTIINNIHTKDRRGSSWSSMSDGSIIRAGDVPYIGLHLRVERDLCDENPDERSFFCSWTPQQWIKCLGGLLVMLCSSTTCEGGVG